MVCVFQAEDGIRDYDVTGVQTCALPIYIFRYVAGEMTDTDGGFYSALDAETDGIEGEFYVWSKKEIVKILGADDAQLFQAVYGMDEANPFEHGFVLHQIGRASCRERV